MRNLWSKVIGDKQDITGEDVAAFCDERLRHTASYADTLRASLNRDVLHKLGPVRRHG